MATFDITLNVTLRVDAPRANIHTGSEGDIRTRMNDADEFDTPAKQARFWRRYVRENTPIFMYYLTSRRDISPSEVTVTQVT